MGPNIPLFSTSDDICPRVQSKCRSLRLHVLLPVHNESLRVTLWLISIAGLGFGFGLVHRFLYYADTVGKGSESEFESLETCSACSVAIGFGIQIRSESEFESGSGNEPLECNTC